MIVKKGATLTLLLFGEAKNAVSTTLNIQAKAINKLALFALSLELPDIEVLSRPKLRSIDIPTSPIDIAACTGSPKYNCPDPGSTSENRIAASGEVNIRRCENSLATFISPSNADLELAYTSVLESLIKSSFEIYRAIDSRILPPGN